MGQYIYVNIATNMIIEKEGRYLHGKRYFQYDDIERELKEKFNFNLYNHQQDETYIYYNIKEEVLEKYLYDFLYEQSEYLLYSQQMKEDLLKIKGKKGSEIINSIKRDELDYIHYFEYSYLKSYYFMKDCHIYLEGICYLSEGEAYFECWYEFFNYIHMQIRKSSKNVLKDAVYLELI